MGAEETSHGGLIFAKTAAQVAFKTPKEIARTKRPVRNQSDRFPAAP
jgi:hypothetical protein